MLRGPKLFRPKRILPEEFRRLYGGTHPSFESLWRDEKCR